MKPTHDNTSRWRRVRGAATGLGDALATPRGAAPGRAAAPGGLRGVTSAAGVAGAS